MSDDQLLPAPPAAAPSDEARLNALKLKRRALEEAREQRQAAATKADAIAEEEQAIEDEEAIAKAEQEIGPERKKIYVVRTAAGVVIVKAPNHILFKRFVDTEDKDTVALERLVRPCLVYPPADRFDRMLESKAAILIKIADAVSWLAGWRAKENEKK